jgi:hypothetical protein
MTGCLSIEFRRDEGAIAGILELIADEGFTLRGIREIPGCNDRALLKLDLGDMGAGCNLSHLRDRLERLGHAHSVLAIAAGEYRS